MWGSFWLVLGSCWIGCAKPAPQTPAQFESPPARVEVGKDVSMEEPRLGAEEP